MRRKERQRDESFAWDVLKKAPFVTVSMIGEDGAPYSVPVNAVVHNMAYFKCEHGTVYHPFGTVNRNALQKKFAIPNAFELPIDLALSKSDELPVMCEHPETPIADTFTNIAESVGMIGACDDRSSAIWCVADTFERRSTRSPSRRMTESSCARSPPPPPKRSK